MDSINTPRKRRRLCHIRETSRTFRLAIEPSSPSSSSDCYASSFEGSSDGEAGGSSARPKTRSRATRTSLEPSAEPPSPAQSASRTRSKTREMQSIKGSALFASRASTDPSLRASRLRTKAATQGDALSSATSMSTSSATRASRTSASSLSSISPTLRRSLRSQTRTKMRLKPISIQISSNTSSVFASLTSLSSCSPSPESYLSGSIFGSQRGDRDTPSTDEAGPPSSSSSKSGGALGDAKSRWLREIAAVRSIMPELPLSPRAWKPLHPATIRYLEHHSQIAAKEDIEEIQMAPPAQPGIIKSSFQLARENAAFLEAVRFGEDGSLILPTHIAIKACV
ncbi:hypothetical protein FA15DRAFT_348922 [Coprinopsis marcescibilis]|uniref:Uncharacterized protein n=1 Tax=Coprinopsis marcescibilis TaxID=230819 RepID=A0A5C3L9Q6_COPMA|nr:hypothetical protein FA15DRAFT_348922 [Coprinopsis marcescibilis]